MNCPRRLSLIGSGFIVDAHEIAVRKMGADRVVLEARSSRDDPRAEVFGRMYGCKAAYVDYAEMLDEQELDGVVTVSPSVAHFEHIASVISSGVKYILCEKPLSPTLDQALKIRAQYGRK